MDLSEFNTARLHRERSFDIVKKICDELGVADERLAKAYGERGISRIQDNRHKEGEADIKECIRVRKLPGNYIPTSGEANLSFSLLAQGKFEECNTLLLDSLACREAALGKDDRESMRTGAILYALGILSAARNK